MTIIRSGRKSRILLWEADYSSEYQAGIPKKQIQYGTLGREALGKRGMELRKAGARHYSFSNIVVRSKSSDTAASYHVPTC
jgi:hypothetical protein